ncbi:hypothetical protein KP509_14G041300 [Ceratopteris richardii]|uniref:Gnk2-homologous domain-containing protein n=1 Tax=Ceratopteris richardii TaxID=49495 RepID=A0A8T2TB98_CERRI|nr:hypothetical protein KP509_14G041300 [Ceratopteris richardii]
MAGFQCRGDLSSELCSQCVESASQTVLSSCPYAIGSRVQKDGCFLRYENYTFAVPDTSIITELCNVDKNNDSRFQADVAQIVARVVSEAPKGHLLYTSATSPVSSSNSSSAPSTLYALAQCLNYLSRSECSECLSAHSSSWQDCDNAVGSQIHSVSCYYRFEIYPFFYK